MPPTSLPFDPDSPSSELDELAAMTGFVSEATPRRSATTAVLERESETADDAALAAECPGSFDAEEPLEEDVAGVLLDPEDFEAVPPSLTRSKTPLWSDPFAKAAVVSVVMAGAVGSVGLFLWSVNGNWSKKITAKPNAPTPEATPSVDPAQAEVGRLKTVAALGTQSQTLEQNQQKAPPRLLNKPNTVKSPLKKATKSTTSGVSEPTTIAPPVRSYAPVVSTPVARPAPIATPSSFSRSTPVAQKSATQALQDAVEVGNYGAGIDNNASAPVATSQTASPNATESAMPAAVAAVPVATTTNAAMPRTVGDDGQRRYDADVNALMTGERTQSSQLAPGATAAASLQTPIIWAQDTQQRQQQQPQQLAVQLDEPLVGADGSVALPAGTQLMAQVDSVSDSGMVQLSVVAAVVPSADGGAQTMPLPPGSLMIAGEGGNPVMAENVNGDKGSGTRKLLGVALSGALGQVGQSLNRPQNESTTTSPYLSSTSVTNGKTNIGGALLQGAFGSIQQQVSDRNQQEAQSSQTRSKVWRVPVGKPLQIYSSSIVEVSQ